jgi:uncharacterized membrane protein YgaE (UPF0421/DUF939 family)
MKPGDLTSGAAKLHQAWQKLSARWELAKRDWHDSVSAEFEERYLAPLEPQIVSTLQRMRSLSNVLTTAQHECDQ